MYDDCVSVFNLLCYMYMYAHTFNVIFFNNVSSSTACIFLLISSDNSRLISAGLWPIPPPAPPPENMVPIILEELLRDRNALLASASGGIRIPASSLIMKCCINL